MRFSVTRMVFPKVASTLLLEAIQTIPMLWQRFVKLKGSGNW